MNYIYFTNHKKNINYFYISLFITIFSILNKKSIRKNIIMHGYDVMMLQRYKIITQI